METVYTNKDADFTQLEIRVLLIQYLKENYVLSFVFLTHDRYLTNKKLSGTKFQVLSD